jgi:hypothetical protein
MRNRMLWIGLGVVLLLVVVTAVVLPRYLVGCRPVPGVPSFAGALIRLALTGPGMCTFRAQVTAVTRSPATTSSFATSLPPIGSTGRPRSPLRLPRTCLR